MFKSVATALACGVCIVASASPAQAQVREYRVPAGSLKSALDAYVRQSGLQVIYKSDEVRRARSAGASGNISAEAALTAILAGTGFKAQKQSSGAIAIVQGSAVASAASSSGEGEPSGEEIVVSGYKFLGVDTSGATNLPVPIEKVPQSISLVSEAFVKAANLKTLGEIAEYTAGAINGGDPASNGSVVFLRGFSSGRAVDGLPIAILSTSYEPDYAVFDRLEVVKGPTSVVYGVSSPGGLVNYVTKSATTRTPSYLLGQVGSWNNYRVEGQLAGALDAAGDVRAIGIAVRDQGDSFQNIQKRAKTSIYLGVDADLSSSLTASLHGGYEKFERNGFDGMPTFVDGSPAPLPRSFFIGAPEIKTTSSVYYAQGDLTWHVSDLWEIGLKGSYETGGNKGSSAYGYRLQPNGNISLSAFNFSQPGTGTDYDNYAIGVSTIYRLNALGLKDSFVSLAAMYQDSRTGFAGSSPPVISVTGNIFNGEASITQALRALVASAVGQPLYVSGHHDTTLTYSGQSVLKLAEPLTVLLGVAYSQPEQRTSGTGGAQTFKYDGQMSYRAGVVYEIAPKLNAYASFSQSFSPQPYSSIDDNGATAPLPTLDGQQYEAGLKYKTGGLLLTGALYRIAQKNQAQFDRFANGTNYYSPIGEVVHKGVELEAVGEITPQWQISAGYAYLNAKVAKDTNVLRIGQERPFLPKQTFSLFSTYELPEGRLQGLTLGAGIRHVSAQHTSYLNAAGVRPTQNLPGYMLVDATVSYAIDKWLVQLNARNLFDKHYFINNYQTLTFGNVVGTPANVTLTVRRDF